MVRPSELHYVAIPPDLRGQSGGPSDAAGTGVSETPVQKLSASWEPQLMASLGTRVPLCIGTSHGLWAWVRLLSPACQTCCLLWRRLCSVSTMPHVGAQARSRDPRTVSGVSVQCV